jgi:hypothetical protein
LTVNTPKCSGSTLPLTLDLHGLTRAAGPRVGASAEKHPNPADDPADVLALRPDVVAAINRASRPDYPRWLAHVLHAGDCTRPIRLRGQLHHINQTTGAVLASTSTLDLPDAVLYTACGNRRASVCPGCSRLYRADTYQLIKAGLVGGKTVPATVATHPCVFLTATAPSFGPVHSTRAGGDGQPRPCRPRRLKETCLHGRALRCQVRHQDDDPLLGQPFCLDCYDHTGQVVWNAYVAELWRRTLLKVNKALKRYGARASFAKVAEMQARGVVHLHALIRLDNLDPTLTTDTGPDGTQVAREVPAPPPASAGLPQLRRALEHAFATTTYRTPPHPDARDDLGGWLAAWGEQLDIRVVRDPTITTVSDGHGALTEEQVAGYLAKYATKSSEATGHTSSRLTADDVEAAGQRGDHVGRLIGACWTLGRRDADEHAARVTGKPVPARLRYGRLRRWAHMLGFGGHFSTKSRRYSTTLAALRRARTDWRETRRRRRELFAGRNRDVVETTLLVGHLAFAGTGWLSNGDALLAATAAAQAREHARNNRDHADDDLASPTLSTAA